MSHRFFSSVKVIRPFSLFLGAFLLLPGCFGEDNNTDGASVSDGTLPFFRIVEHEDFMLQVPESWETIQNFDSNYPKNTVVAFRNNIQDHDFIANLNVVRNPLSEGTLPTDYALKVYQSISKQLIGFKEIRREEISLFLGSTEMSTYRFEFEGTNDASQPVRRFVQTYGIKGSWAYIVTGTYDPADTELTIDQVRQGMTTFRLK